MGQVNVIGQVKDNNFVQIVDDELVDKDDVPIPGVSAVPWATFVGGGFDLTRARNVLISDRKIRPNGGWPLFFIDPAATTQKRILQSRTLYVDTFANLVANYPAASWPGLCVYLGDLGIEVFSNGARYVPVGGEALLFQGVYGTLAAPTKNTGTGTSYQFDIGSPTVPGGLFAAGDMLFGGFRTLKHNGNGVITTHKMTLGSTGTVADAAIWSGQIPIADLTITTSHTEITVGSATVLTSNSSGSITGTGAAGIAVDVTTNFNVANNNILGIGGSGKNNLDTLDLLHFYLKWSAR